MPIQQLNQTHALRLGQQEWDVIYPLRLDRQCFIPVISVPESGECVQIDANRELLSFSLLIDGHETAMFSREGHFSSTVVKPLQTHWESAPFMFDAFCCLEG